MGSFEDTAYIDNNFNEEYVENCVENESEDRLDTPVNNNVSREGFFLRTPPETIQEEKSWSIVGFPESDLVYEESPNFFEEFRNNVGMNTPNPMEQPTSPPKHKRKRTDEEYMTFRRRRIEWD